MKGYQMIIMKLSQLVRATDIKSGRKEARLGDDFRGKQGKLSKGKEKAIKPKENFIQNGQIPRYSG